VTERHDVVIVGSGMGGAMAAHALVDAGLDVLMIERGVPVDRGEHNWARDAVLELSPYYTRESHYLVRGDDRGRRGTFQCVGGPAVFYGGVALRLRETDFSASPEVVGDSGAEWPFGYDEMAPHYATAERILGVAGRPGENHTDPPGTDGYAQVAPEAQGPARLMWDTARDLGLRPSHLPLAIDFDGLDTQTGPCVRCGTCDGYACAVGAKREPASAILPRLVNAGLKLVTNTVVVRLLRTGSRVDGVIGVDRATGRRHTFRGDRYILAAGALGSPHLVLASGLEGASPARDWIGRCLMRHCNGIVYGLFPEPLAGARTFHKQVGIFDHYGGGDDGGRNGTGDKLGCLQSIHPPPPGMIQDRLPGFLGGIADPLADRCAGLLAIAEDEPRRENRVSLSRSESDRYGLVRAVVTHRYTARDIDARDRLARVARSVLKTAGARITHMFPIRTFSHAVGTLRMGADPRTSPLDESSRFRGIDNLWVTDGSFMPRSGGVNPSLTIAANALRAAGRIAERGRAEPAVELRGARR
jgi:choline dehydrogenase-like flavoprotein